MINCHKFPELIQEFNREGFQSSPDERIHRFLPIKYDK